MEKRGVETHLTTWHSFGIFVMFVLSSWGYNSNCGQHVTDSTRFFPKRIYSPYTNRDPSIGRMTSPSQIENWEKPSFQKPVKPIDCYGHSGFFKYFSNSRIWTQTLSVNVFDFFWFRTWPELEVDFDRCLLYVRRNTIWECCCVQKICYQKIQWLEKNTSLPLLSTIRIRIFKFQTNIRNFIRLRY